jgi:chaperonin GroES
MIRPLDDRLVVEPLPQNEGTLIEVPDIAQGPPMRGRVLAVGPGKRKQDKRGNPKEGRIPCALKGGEVVTFGQFSIDLEYDGVCLIREGDVLVVEN